MGKVIRFPSKPTLVVDITIGKVSTNAAVDESSLTPEQKITASLKRLHNHLKHLQDLASEGME
jgi:hypothetical protein